MTPPTRHTRKAGASALLRRTRSVLVSMNTSSWPSSAAAPGPSADVTQGGTALVTLVTLCVCLLLRWLLSPLPLLLLEVVVAV